MSRQVDLSNTAERQLDKLLKYLHTNWSENVKLRFITKLENRIDIVKLRPSAFPESKIKKGLHSCVVTRQTTIYYTFDESNIFILAFFDNRQDPNKLIKEVL